MEVAVFPLGPLDTNCCLIHNAKEAVVTDPGGDPAEVLRYLKDNNLTLTHILLTHLHFDHAYGVHELAKATGAPVFGNNADGYMLDNEMGLGGMWGLPRVEPYTLADIKPGSVPMLGATCEVLGTPGHTPGGLSFYFAAGTCVFSGDTLFYRSVGRSDFPGGDQAVLEHSIRTVLYALPEDTRVYPGHGRPTNIGDEKRNNPHVSDFKV